ncbi:hypothetical protein [Leptospira noguchii]|uniref:hypothetical protein n=1 Tax=Leptospira noguchii TaxID=28182 RepID=UPI001FB67881|nr:hypothetical protein [Leptospira noguchii]UOG31221.1 hypothetical protein MAL06_04005 [Leptospira noguchii]UOG34850.1 hypothetical protein MAL02_03655 [Leptospira noguchii]UOG45749.1 hypothetical protein MAL01_03760 [Leptospira noguchii]
MGTITKLEILLLQCGNYYKVRNPTSPNVGTITKLEIPLLQCGNYYKIRNPTSPMWELLQS